MVNITKIHTLYDAMIKVEEISTKEIKNLDFSTNDVSELVDTGIITRIRRGYYKIGDISKLYAYGRLLIEFKRRDEAISCFEKCFELDNTNVEVAHQLFINSIKVQDYSNTFNYFDVLYNSDNNSKRYLFYLYLLSFIIELPDKYIGIVSNITYDDLKYDEEDPKNKHQNYIINLVMSGKLPYAFSKKNNVVYFEDYADRVILKEATSSYAKYKNELETLIKDSKYSDAITLLRNESNVRNLSIYNSYLLYLMEDILSIKDTGVVKDVIETEHTVNMFNAVNNNNYELALKLCKEHNEKINLKNEDSMMYLLLSRIVELKKEYVTEDLKEEVVEEEVAKEDTQVIEEVSKVPFSDVVSSLLLNDIDKFKELLHVYLESKNLLNNYDFINLFVELCMIEKTDYSRVLVVITQIVNGSYVFDETYYVKAVYECISNRELKKARIYLNMLDCSNYVLNELIMELHKVLDALEVSYQDVNNVNVVEEAVVTKEIGYSEPVQETVTYNQSVQEKVIPKKKYYDSADKQFVLEKLDILKQNRGIIVLRPMDSDRRKSIHHVVERIKELNSFSIGSENNRRIVLRYNACQYVDIKSTISEADRLFYSKQYSEALQLYLDILGTNSPKTFIYAKVGLTYLKMNNIEEAIKYLTVATELAKVTKEDFDFSDLIASLDGTISEFEKKPKFRMSEKDFIDDLNNNFGVDKFDEMYACVTEVGMSVEDACEGLDFTKEEYQLSLLLIARKYYADGIYETGDSYFKKLEKSDNKSKKVINKMEEVRRNKKFYVHRKSNETQTIKSSM